MVGHRYYNPEWGRWLSPDDIEYLDPESINGLNLYAYCANNPVMNIDPDGHAWYNVLGWIGVGLVAAAATVLTLGAFGVAVGGAGLLGAVIHGAAVGTLIGAGAGIIGGAAGGMIYDAYYHNEFGTSIWEGIQAGFGIGAIAGMIIGGTIGGLNFGTFSSKSALNTHFVKHGDEFNGLYKSAAEYAKGAKYTIKNGQYVPEMNGYIRFFGSQGKANYAFVGMKSYGRVSTYGIRAVAELAKKLPWLIP